jgi:hypothetical protein
MHNTVEELAPEPKLCSFAVGYHCRDPVADEGRYQCFLVQASKLYWISSPAFVRRLFNAKMPAEPIAKSIPSLKALFEHVRTRIESPSVCEGDQLTSTPFCGDYKS